MATGAQRSSLLSALLVLLAPAAVSATRAEDDESQGGGALRGRVTGLAFSSFFSHGEEVEEGLGELFQEIDQRMKALSPTWARRGECGSMAKELIDAGTAPPRKGKRQVHTGSFLKGRYSKKLQGGARKLRLGIMSFLTTQDLNHTHLNFWVDVPMTHPLLQKTLAPLAAHPDFKRSVSVRIFDAEHEFNNLSPKHGEVLLQAYQQNTEQLPSRSDLERIVLLYNYGGIWMDSDVLMIQDFAPLFGQDWAYLGQKDFINNAVLSVSKPKSPFMGAYLVHAAAKGVNGGRGSNVYRYGPLMLRSLYKDVGGNGTFHVLPACFFDGGWSGVRNAVHWDGFFGGEAKPKQVDYVTPGNEARRAFAYHWHGRWERPIQSGSVADVAEHAYAERLGVSII